MSNLKQQAESGLSTIEDAVIEFVKQHPEGVSNKQIAVELGLSRILKVSIQITFHGQF